MSEYREKRELARKLVREKFEGCQFRAKAVRPWIEQQRADRWHLYKAFDEFKRSGLIVRVSGRLHGTVYRWDMWNTGEKKMEKNVTVLPKWAQEQIQVLEMRVKELDARARAYEEKKPTKVFIKYLRLDTDDKPVYLPDDRQIRFVLGEADWQYVDVRIKKTIEQKELFIELMAGGDLVIAPEVRNVSRIFVK